MKKITEKLKNNWRKLVSASFIMLAFLTPTTRDFLSKILDVNVYASNNGNNKNKYDSSKSTQSVSQKSVSCPDSQDAVSPMKNSQSNSTNKHSHSSSNSKKVVKKPYRK